MIKKVQQKTDFFINLTSEEIKSFGWEENQKLSIIENGDGGVVLIPYAKMEIDLDEFTKDELMDLINQSCERDMSMNDLIEEILVNY